MSTNRCLNTKCLFPGISTARTEIKIPSVSSGNGESTPNPNLQFLSEIIHSRFCPLLSNATIETLSSFGEVRKITAGEPPVTCLPSRASTCSCAFICRQASSIQNATEDDISFIDLTSFVGIKRATQLAATLHLQVQQPLLGSHASLNARGRNYSARNAKRKLLSGSSASLKKR